MPRGVAFWSRPFLYSIREYVFEYESAKTSEARVFLERGLDTLYDLPRTRLKRKLRVPDTVAHGSMSV